LILRLLAARHKISAMSGVDEYKTRKGNQSGLSAVGFLSSRHPSHEGYS
jgi:hypothetical protein